MKATLWVVFAALALAGCGDDHIKPMSVSPEQAAPGTAVAQPAPQAAPAPAAQHSDSGMSPWLAAAIGYMLGSSGSRSQPVAVPQASAYPAPQVAKPSWLDRYRARQAAKRAEAAAAKPQVPPPSKPPVLSTSPKTFSIPKPAAAPKPSYSGPSSYGRTTSSFSSRSSSRR